MEICCSPTLKDTMIHQKLAVRGNRANKPALGRSEYGWVINPDLHTVCIISCIILNTKYEKVCGHTDSTQKGQRFFVFYAPPTFCGACLFFSRESSLLFSSSTFRVEAVFTVGPIDRSKKLKSSKFCPYDAPQGASLRRFHKLSTWRAVSPVVLSVQ